MVALGKPCVNVGRATVRRVAAHTMEDLCPVCDAYCWYECTCECHNGEGASGGSSSSNESDSSRDEGVGVDPRVMRPRLEGREHIVHLRPVIDVEDSDKPAGIVAKVSEARVVCCSVTTSPCVAPPPSPGLPCGPVRVA